MSESIRDTIQSIMVALDNSRRSGLVLETAARLAAELQAELQGLFVEDENLLRLACMPFACEIDGTTALPRPLNPEVIERTFRAKAEEAKQALMATARRLQVQWSFQVRRGQVLRTTFAAAEGADVIILEPQSPAHANVFTSRRHDQRISTAGSSGTSDRIDRKNSVAVIIDGSNGSFRALRLALYLCRHTAINLMIFVTPIGSTDPGKLQHLTHEIIRGESLPGDVGIEIVSTQESFATSLEANKPNFQLALLSLESLASDGPGPQFIIQQLRCPLALVR